MLVILRAALKGLNRSMCMIVYNERSGESRKSEDPPRLS